MYTKESKYWAQVKIICEKYGYSFEDWKRDYQAQNG